MHNRTSLLWQHTVHSSAVNCNQRDKVWQLGYGMLHVKNNLSTIDKSVTRFVYSDGPSKLQEAGFSS